MPGEIEDAIGLGNISRAAREIKDLGILGKDMAKRGEEDQVKYVIRGLRLAGLEAVGKGKEFEGIASASINELREVGLEATRKKLDAQEARALFSDIIGFTVVSFSATASALNALKDVGTKAAEADMGDATFSAIEYLGEVGIAAMENELNHQDTINEAVLGLEEAGKKAAEKGLTRRGNHFLIVSAVEKLMEFGNKAIKHKYETEPIVNALWVLCAASTEYSDDFDIARRVISFVRKIPSKALAIVTLFEKGFDNGWGYVDKKFPDLIDSLREFKKRYEER